MMRRSSRRARAVVGVASLIVTFAAFPSSATLAPSTFDAADGNFLLDDTTDVGTVPGANVDAKDWQNAPALQTATDTPTGQNDNSLVEGTKEDSAVPTVETGSIPNNKSDLQQFYVSNEKVGTKEFLYLAWTRANTLGTANMDFEFNKNKCVKEGNPPAPTADSTCSANGITPVRSPGDMLITFDFASGGNKVQLALLRWVTTGANSQCEANGGKVPCWGNKLDLDAASVAEGAVNDGYVVKNTVTNGNQPDKTFGEASIDLTGAGVFTPNVCSGFGSAYLKSRSSDSFTAAMKDVIAPIPVSIQNCGRIIIHKQTTPQLGNASPSFAFTSTGGLSPSSFSLKDDGVQDYGSNVQTGVYTISETDPTGLTPKFDLKTLACTVTGSNGSTYDANAGTTTSGSGVAPRTVSIDLKAGDTVDCTFTNEQRGSIVVQKVTDPASDTTTSFGFTAGGGLSPTSFNLTGGGSRTFADLTPSSGYTLAETVPTGWDLVSATCDDGSAVTNISVSAGETVTCTFTNRARGSVSIQKRDDAGNALQGAIFTLYVDNAPLGPGTPRGPEDTMTTKTCTTPANGNCTITDVVPGRYWVVETTGVPGHSLAPDQNVVVTAGVTAGPLTFVNPRQHVVIVLVCHEGTNTLASSSVTVDGTTLSSLSSAPGGLTEAQLCALSGARFTGRSHGTTSASVNIPTH